ncbi:hypothetical protein [Orrella sp. 11846]|uniref:hypothetical protein n=1 Tax=Orrella sp. 11846 TaxID=3409913 RepID=UPI003B58D35D
MNADSITQFDPTTGKLGSVITGPPVVLEPTKALGDFVDGIWDADTYYVLDDTPTPRPENPTSLNDLTLENVPVPAIITINSQTYETESDTIELEFDQVGTYKVTIESFPYLTKEFEIEITTL